MLRLLLSAENREARLTPFWTHIPELTNLHQTHPPKKPNCAANVSGGFGCSSVELSCSVSWKYVVKLKAEVFWWNLLTHLLVKSEMRRFMPRPEAAQLSLAWHKDWRQRATASLARSKGNKNLLTCTFKAHQLTSCISFARRSHLEDSAHIAELAR